MLTHAYIQYTRAGVCMRGSPLQVMTFNTRDRSERPSGDDKEYREVNSWEVQGGFRGRHHCSLDGKEERSMREEGGERGGAFCGKLCSVWLIWGDYLDYLWQLTVLNL